MSDERFEVHVGMRVQVYTKKRELIVGRVVEIDESVFPGTIHVKDDKGNRHEAWIDIGPVGGT